MDFWNKRDLNGPPVLTYPTKQRMLNLPEFNSHFINAVRFTSNHGFLQQEAALLSRINYKMRWKFSKDKFLNAMQKTNKALRLYLQLNMQTLFTLYKDSIPVQYEQETYFPTIDMLDFVLVRLQGACKLLIRMRDSARTAALYLGEKLVVGHFWMVTLLCLGTVSRLAQVGNEICRYFSNLYDTLLKYRAHFKNAGEKWLPDNYPFPVSMQTWLDVEFDVSTTDNLQTYDLSLAESVQAFNQDIGTIAIESDSDTDEVELVDEYFDLNDDVRSKKNVTRPQCSIYNGKFIMASTELEGTVFDVDSDDDLYGIEVDKFGNVIDKPAGNPTKRGPQKIETSQKNVETCGTFVDELTDSVRKITPNTYTENVPLQRVIAKIFQSQRNQLISKISKKQMKAPNQNPSVSNVLKRNYEKISVLSNLNSKQAFFEFLNKQQQLLKQNSETCVFSHLNIQRFFKVRKQITYILNTVNSTKEALYERCREILHENMVQGAPRIDRKTTVN